ncbi:cobalamin biosynthesis protein [Tumidithrix elongata RA019]|uniref:Cobalamin biosynthesis protein n=1 Tax=Tumidithrix elongata BACA0141 TaxID=2716417 RepID=A0AAW9Q5H2_9CYAN|nr:cobalamin biosynthesis protein [Tumidithrix elongata RA019]
MGDMELLDIETLGEPLGWQRGSGNWQAVNDAIARREPIQVIQEVGSTLWQTHLPEGHSFQFGFPEIHNTTPSPKARVWISHIQRQFSPESDFPKVQWHPRVLWIGIGCERGTSAQTIAQAIAIACRSRHLSEQAIAGIATIDRKVDEVGLLEFCRDRDLPLRFYNSESLGAIAVPNPNSSVDREVGTPSVSEAAAILTITEIDSIPLADLDLTSILLIPKQIFKQPNQKGSVTVAIAVAIREYHQRYELQD